MCRRPRRSAALLGDVSAASTLAVVPAAIYLVINTVAACRGLRRARSSKSPQDAHGEPIRFVVLVPAHNEEMLVGDVVASLLAASGAAHPVDVVVVTDHCTDRTASVAENAGAQVLLHDDPEPRGKGPALRWALHELDRRGREHDVVVIVDADSVVDAGFFEAIAARFRSGSQVVQAYYTVRNPEESTAAGLRTIALAVRHLIRPLGRCGIGGSSGLYGNGMAFDAELARSRPWTDHLTEDLDYQLALLSDGILVDVEPSAVIAAEMPTSLDASTTQHERWEQGRLDLARRHAPTLFDRALRGPRGQRIAAADALADLLLPPMSILAAATTATTCAASVAARRSPTALTRIGRAAGTGAALALTAHVAAGVAAARLPIGVLRSLVAAPRLVVWKVLLWTRVATGSREVEWIRTQRNLEESDENGDSTPSP